MANSSYRIWEIDFMRGVAILLMVVFHLVFDLSAYWGYNLSYTDGFWYYEGRSSAVLFMAVAGISATLNVRRFRKGMVVFAWGLLITLITYFVDPRTYIRFGILHLLGSCMLLFPFIKNVKAGWLVAAGTIAIAAGQWMDKLPVTSSLLIPLGATPSGFASVDYYPLLPWSGIFLYGAALGQVLYKERRSLLPPPSWSGRLTTLGRHSLAVYLIHQPVLLTLLYIGHLLYRG